MLCIVQGKLHHLQIAALQQGSKLVVSDSTAL